MKLFVGLGNIGKKYDNTPHNAGFDFVDKLRDYLGFDALYSVDDWSVEKLADASICYIRKGGVKVGVLVKPHTFMNLSGHSVAKLVKMFDLDAKTDLIVVHDDLDVKLGEYKIQRGIGPKGHKGVNSVINHVGGTDFLRVRLGVETRDRDGTRDIIAGEDFVLKRYGDDDSLLLEETIDDAIRGLRSMVEF
jgi:PTH1 family peptidyl-tRNA hydrolase